MNKDQLINNNQYNAVGVHMLIFLKMDLKYSKNTKCINIIKDSLLVTSTRQKGDKIIKHYLS